MNTTLEEKDGFFFNSQRLEGVWYSAYRGYPVVEVEEMQVRVTREKKYRWSSASGKGIEACVEKGESDGALGEFAEEVL